MRKSVRSRRIATIGRRFSLVVVISLVFVTLGAGSAVAGCGAETIAAPSPGRATGTAPNVGGLAPNPALIGAGPAPILRDVASRRPLAPVGTGSPSLDRTRYVWDAEVAGVARCVIIDAPNPTAVTRPAGLIFFHGRGGDAPGTEALLNLARRIPEVVVVYAEGQDGVHRLDGRGWEIRFPHAHYVCGEGMKDLPYVDAILDQLASAHDVDKNRVFFAGHSNGGFFSLSLAEIMADRLRGVVAIGAYTSYAPAPWLIDCGDPYGDGFTGMPAGQRTESLDALNRGIKSNPVDTLLIFGRKEAVVRRAPNWSPRCDTFTYLRHSLIQLTLKKRLGGAEVRRRQQFHDAAGPPGLRARGAGQCRHRGRDLRRRPQPALDRRPSRRLDRRLRSGKAVKATPPKLYRFLAGSRVPTERRRLHYR